MVYVLLAKEGAHANMAEEVAPIALEGVAQIAILQGVDGLARVIDASATRNLLEGSLDSSASTLTEAYMEIENRLFDTMEGVPGGVPYDMLRDWSLAALEQSGIPRADYYEDTCTFFRKLAKRGKQKKGRVEELGQRLTAGQAVTRRLTLIGVFLMVILTFTIGWDWFVVSSNETDTALAGTRDHMSRLFKSGSNAAVSVWGEGSVVQLLAGKMVVAYVGTVFDSWAEARRAKLVALGTDVEVGDVLWRLTQSIGALAAYALGVWVKNALYPPEVRMAMVGPGAVLRTVRRPAAGPGSYPPRPALQPVHDTPRLVGL